MRLRKDYIDILSMHSGEMRTRYGVSSMRLFGSVARDEHSADSDVDICVDMPPRIFKLAGLCNYLEEILGCHVDVVREHSNMNPLLKKEIEHDGIYIFN